MRLGSARHARRAACLLALLAVRAEAAPAPLPTPIGLVSDFAGAIDAATEARLTRRIQELKEKTGAEIAVVTLATTAPDAVPERAVRLAEAWKPGDHAKDNGVLFLVAVEDRELFIATGYGIEGALPDGLLGEIRDRTIIPKFRAGDIAGGIEAGVDRMAAIIAHEYRVELTGSPLPDAPSGGRRFSTGDLIILAIILLVIFGPYLFSSANDPPGASGRRRRRSWDVGPPMWSGTFGGGGFGGSGGGGFGGFGGGSFGGGGAGGKW